MITSYLASLSGALAVRTSRGIVVTMSVQLLEYSSRELPDSLKCQILSFLRTTWPEDFVGPNRLRTWLSPESHHPLHLLLVENGILISHLEIKWKNLDHAGQTYKLYGLSGVLTYPAFRGEGHASHLVRIGTVRIRASGGDIGMFHCRPALRSFYTRAGWIPIDRATTLVGMPSAPVPSENLMMMLFLSDKAVAHRSDFEIEPVYFGRDTW